MARVQTKHTKPEIAVRRHVHGMGLRYRLHSAQLPGKPDLVLVRHKKAIFVHGCFWHGHKGCARAGRPSTNKNFWRIKLDSNLARDIRNRRALRKLGWKVLTVWECETRNELALNKKLHRFLTE